MKDYDNLYAVKHSHSAGTPIDFDAYTKYVTKLASNIDGAVVAPETLDAILMMAVAAGDIIDLYKKQIVYDRGDLRKSLLDAIMKLRSACITLDDVVFNEVKFQPDARVKALNLPLLHAALGAFGEWAEILAAIRGHFHTGAMDDTNVIEELGDAGYYDAAAHDAVGIPKHVTMGRNSAKLDVRFGGAFSFEKVNNRNLAAERLALEGTSPL